MRIAAVADHSRSEQRRRIALRDAGQEACEPVAERNSVENAPHEIGLDQDRRKKIHPRGFPRCRRIDIVEVPRTGLRFEHVAQNLRIAIARVVERERKGERRVGVNAVTDRVGRVGEPFDVALGKHVRERHKIARPAVSVVVAPA